MRTALIFNKEIKATNYQIDTYKKKIYIYGIASSKNEKDLVRDSFSNAIINKDDDAYLKYMKRISRQQEKENEIEQLKSDVKEIKELLTKILERT